MVRQDYYNSAALALRSRRFDLHSVWLLNYCVFNSARIVSSWLDTDEDLGKSVSKINTVDMLSKIKTVSSGLSGTIPKPPLFVYRTNGFDWPDAAITTILSLPDDIP